MTVIRTKEELIPLIQAEIEKAETSYEFYAIWSINIDAYELEVSSSTILDIFIDVDYKLREYVYSISHDFAKKLLSERILDFNDARMDDNTLYVYSLNASKLLNIE